MLMVLVGNGPADALTGGPFAMVAIPVGTFTMGNDDNPEDEYPAHRVNVPAFAPAESFRVPSKKSRRRYLKF